MNLSVVAYQQVCDGGNFHRSASNGKSSSPPGKMAPEDVPV
jgi:hypothetical protein